jgi:large subunit ribosomal protein L27
MSKTKAGGTSKNNRDSPGQRLGVKVYGGQHVQTGDIIVRQRGSSKIAGDGVSYGRDHSIYANREGVVEFKRKRITHFTGSKVRRTEVNVVPAQALSA